MTRRSRRIWLPIAAVAGVSLVGWLAWRQLGQRRPPSFASGNGRLLQVEKRA